MAEPLKHLIGAEVVRSIARDLARVYQPFREREFVRDCLTGLDQLELVARGRHIANALREHLPASFPKASKLLVRSLGPKSAGHNEPDLSVFRYLPHSSFVQHFGLDHFEAAMEAQYELTQRFTAEFSIRPFIERYPDATYARLLEWTRDPSCRVRRLVSEGSRPRLPWAPRLRAFQQDPRPVLRLLERLKDDPERYVQRSVANNLNDIGKDHPDLVVEVCRDWARDAPPGRSYIVKHALRSLLKRGHPDALSTLGVGATPRVRLSQVTFSPRRVRIGETLRFSLVLESAAPGPQTLLVDYAVHFVKANGDEKPKVFKLRRIELPSSAKLALEARVSLENLTTRKHYPGKHRVELLINGVAFPLGHFEARA